MKLTWAKKELSVGVYVYVVDDDSGRPICYVRETTPEALTFVKTLCQSPELLPEVLANLAPGKEVRAGAIYKILFGELKHENS